VGDSRGHHGGFRYWQVPGSASPTDKPNSFFLSGEGLAKLESWLESGCYRVRFPEHGALLSVAWLTHKGRVEEARKIMNAISPFLDSLRFYPDDAEESVEEVRARLGSLTNARSADLEAQSQAYRFWVPLKLKLVGLFGETVDAEGWPLQKIPCDWNTRAGVVLAEYERISDSLRDSRVVKFGTGAQRIGSNFHTLIFCLRAAVAADGARAEIPPRTFGLLRITLLDYRSRFGGLPGSAKFQASFGPRQAMMDQVLSIPPMSVFADACSARLCQRQWSAAGWGAYKGWLPRG